MTSKDSSPSAKCRSAREEFPALVYGELEGESKRRVERHIDGCPACRAVIDEHRRTMARLDEWTIEDAVPQRAGRAAAADSRGRLRRLSRLRPALIGMAAGLIVFAALGSLGTDLRYADGRLVVAVGRGDGASHAGMRDVAAAVAPALRAVAREEVDLRINRLSEALDAALTEMTEIEEHRRMLLVRAVDWRGNEDRRRQRALLDGLVERQRLEIGQLRSDLDEVIALVSRERFNPDSETDSDIKEKS